MEKIESSDGQFLELLPVGTRVKHKKHPELVGKISKYEYHESGKVSPIPYSICWDDPEKAFSILGFMNYYQKADAIEREVEG